MIKGSDWKKNFKSPNLDRRNGNSLQSEEDSKQMSRISIKFQGITRSLAERWKQMEINSDKHVASVKGRENNTAKSGLPVCLVLERFLRTQAWSHRHLTQKLWHLSNLHLTARGWILALLLISVSCHAAGIQNLGLITYVVDPHWIWSSPRHDGTLGCEPADGNFLYLGPLSLQ